MRNQKVLMGDGAALGECALKPGEALVKNSALKKPLAQTELVLWMAVAEDETEKQNWFEITFLGKVETTLSKN